jgi:hypothetical protein
MLCCAILTSVNGAVVTAVLRLFKVKAKRSDAALAWRLTESLDHD